MPIAELIAVPGVWDALISNVWVMCLFLDPGEPLVGGIDPPQNHVG